MARRRSVDGGSSVDGLARRQRDADIVAETLGPSVLNHPVGLWRSLIRTMTELQTAAFVRFLIRAADRAVEGSPAKALQLATFAVDVAVAMVIDEAIVTNTARSDAWNTVAVAHVSLGQYPEALEALALAASYANALPHSDFQMALLAYTRADAHRQMCQFDEALKSIREAGATFLAYGDHRKFLSASQVEAVILRRMGAPGADPVALYRSMLQSARALGDEEALARIHVGFGNSLYFNGSYAEALECYALAGKTFRRLGLTGPLVMVDLGRARILAATGSPNEAADQYRDVLARLAKSTKSGDWVHVSIEYVELLLSLGEDREVQRMCLRLVSVARAAGMKPAVVEAVAFMRVAARSRSLTLERARYVRGYLETLPDYPEMPFAPPPTVFGS